MTGNTVIWKFTAATIRTLTLGMMNKQQVHEGTGEASEQARAS